MYTRFMAKKKTFASSMRRSQSEKQSPPQLEVAGEIPISEESKGQGTSTPPSRKGKIPLTGFIDKDAMRHIKVYCAREDMAQQTLVITAVNEYLTSRGEPGIL